MFPEWNETLITFHEQDELFNKFHERYKILVERLEMHGFKVTMFGREKPKGFIQHEIFES